MKVTARRAKITSAPQGWAGGEDGDDVGHGELADGGPGVPIRGRAITSFM